VNSEFKKTQENSVANNLYKGYCYLMQLKAEIEDSTHLKLKQPLNAKAGTKVLVEIVEDSEREEFMYGAAALLERAYSDDEPDYSQSGTPIHTE
jgi:hypothetical protein